MNDALTKLNPTFEMSATVPAKIGPIVAPTPIALSYDPTAAPTCSFGKWREIRLMLNGKIIAKHHSSRTVTGRKAMKLG